MTQLSRGRGLTRRERAMRGRKPLRHQLEGRRTIKRAALRDCGRRCVYCGDRLQLETATLDHVYPRAKGGPNLPGNLVPACVSCNQMKADMLPFEFFARYPWAGQNFVRYARTVHRSLKRGARRALSLAMAA
jgi:5-methylcytosine-specific restriction endonuclease McrA